MSDQVRSGQGRGKKVKVSSLSGKRTLGHPTVGF